MSTSLSTTTNGVLLAKSLTPPPPPPPPKIAVIICSQRCPRIGDQIGTFVYDALKQYQTTAPDSSSYELCLVDLADHPLPFFDEPVIPQTITSPLDYHHEHTRQWSRLISSCSAFVFVTPQYNWSFPANLKNAIDYLFHEWAGKPAMVVSYGGHGGGKSAEQLTQVLSAVRMNVVSRTVGLMFPKQGEDGRAFLKKAARGSDLGLAGERKSDEVLWAKEMGAVRELFAELVGMMMLSLSLQGEKSAE
ncbi:NAD(P)H-dependent FMN reductase [Cladophialophora carrionii]|uniref:NAD(P)H-dependent FMN reductase n=1 Tax=Cladophialophora carrionii TaxID=86049 RepID=A0A1C1CG33_9EURO|nr:NAD(P)H-dependent FMN reductase [Cladophialophora carrionii]